MKDIPMFTTDDGIASLALKEVPYRQTAYIRVRDVQPGKLDALLKECKDFCRAVGADKIYWNGGEVDHAEPHAIVYEMRGTAWVDRSLLENLFPVTEATVARWREIHNRRMEGVDHAATLTAADEKRILESGGAYFIHRSGALLGIGWLDGERLLAIAAVQPGSGERVAHTLMSVIEGSSLSLEVVSTNERAIRLYERLGFLKTGEAARWYAL